MRAATFNKLALEHLGPGAIVPPVVGILNGLRIAACVVRDHSMPTGVVLLANDRDPSRHGPEWDTTCLKRYGSVALDVASEADIHPWEVSVEVATHKVVSLVGRAATEKLFADAAVRLDEFSGDMVGTLTVRSPDPIDEANVNSTAFDSVEWLPVSLLS